MQMKTFTAVYCLFTGSMLSEGLSRVPGDVVLSSGDLGLACDYYKGSHKTEQTCENTILRNNIVLVVKYLLSVSCSTEAEG